MLNTYRYFLLIIGFFTVFGVNAQTAVRQVPNNAFKLGEKLTYKIKYNLYFNISVGQVEFEIKSDFRALNNSSCYHITATGKTFGFYDPFFKVRDKYEAFVEQQSILPLLSNRDVAEGGYKFGESVVFNQAKSTIKSVKGSKKVPKSTMDVITTLYYARTIDFSKAQPGDKYLMNTFLDDSAYNVSIEYKGVETIKTGLGKFRCVKLSPSIISDRIFKKNSELFIFVTDDPNHLPIRIEANLNVGSIKADLTGYDNLLNNLSAKL